MKMICSECGLNYGKYCSMIYCNPEYVEKERRRHNCRLLKQCATWTELMDSPLFAAHSWHRGECSRSESDVAEERAFAAKNDVAEAKFVFRVTLATYKTAETWAFSKILEAEKAAVGLCVAATVTQSFRIVSEISFAAAAADAAVVANAAEFTVGSYSCVGCRRDNALIAAAVASAAEVLSFCRTNARTRALFIARAAATARIAAFARADVAAKAAALAEAMDALEARATAAGVPLPARPVTSDASRGESDSNGHGIVLLDEDESTDDDTDNDDPTDFYFCFDDVYDPSYNNPVSVIL